MKKNTRGQQMSRTIFEFYKKFIIILLGVFSLLVLGAVIYYPAIAPISTSPSIILSGNIQTIEDENIRQCITDQGAYVGGCSQGYTCFEQGQDQGCSRGKDCSLIKFNRVGDNKCHKSCQSNDDCVSGYTCLEKEVWHGDSGQTYKLCL